MKNYILAILALLIYPAFLFSQEKVKDSVPDKPERAAFESSFIIDNPTDIVFTKKTFEFTINHRFGTFNGGTNDLIGFWAPSNIRIGLAYAPHDRITVGFGTTKFDRLQDFNWKVGLLRQTRSGKIPVNISYYGNFVIDARKKENFALDQHRYSFFNQLIFSRRFTPGFSLQIAPSVSHFNVVDANMQNDRWAIALGGRAKISPQSAIIWDYSQPITQFDINPDLNNYGNKPGVSIGIEIRTSSHAFQIFFSNYNGIVPQQSYVKNENDFFDGDILIGFNITRLYNF
ncbi:MAG: DUF5777 family beta-barrel protein [Flavobacteriaceae bacterium]